MARAQHTTHLKTSHHLIERHDTSAANGKKQSPHYKILNVVRASDYCYGFNGMSGWPVRMTQKKGTTGNVVNRGFVLGLFLYCFVHSKHVNPPHPAPKNSLLAYHSSLQSKQANPNTTHHVCFFQIANIWSDICIDSAAKQGDMLSEVGLWPCHGQGGNQVENVAQKRNCSNAQLLNCDFFV